MKKIIPSVYGFFRDRPHFDWLFFGVLLGLYVILATWQITAGSIWFDEAFSAYIIHYNFIDIARYTASDVHPPFYYWLLQAWAAIFGHSELGLRSMSVFFGAVAASFGYLFVRRKFGRRASLVALAILVLSPLFIRYSQEARMYTLSAAITIGATYVLAIATEQKKRWQWLVYGVLVSLGMLTHYFTALVWIVHWVWRYLVLRKEGVRGKVLLRRFFSKDWLWAYGVAVGLYLFWLPFMAKQLFIIQANGFWISPVGLDTVGSYFGTLVYFLQSYQITGWFAALLVAVGVTLTILAVRAHQRLKLAERRWYMLLFLMAILPPVLLFVASLPPLTSSFVERYLFSAAIATALFVGVVLSIGMRGKRIWQQFGLAAVIGAMLLTGLNNMYFYGNYNKNSRTDIKTEQVVAQASARSDDGVPIVTNTPWVFYEAVFYDTPQHPIYFLDESTEYGYGSLDMLKESDNHKIKDLDAFAEEHPVFWYIGYADGELRPPRDAWKVIDSVAETSHVDGKTVYKGIKIQAR